MSRLPYPWYCLKIDITKCFYHVPKAKVLDMFRSVADNERLIELVSAIIKQKQETNVMSWRNDPITEKQEMMIAQIEEDAVMNDAFIPPFSGTTKGEACDYIGNYIHACHLSAFDPNEDAGDRV